MFFFRACCVCEKKSGPPPAPPVATALAPVSAELVGEEPTTEVPEKLVSEVIVSNPVTATAGASNDASDAAATTPRGSKVARAPTSDVIHDIGFDDDGDDDDDAV
mmetsp:Transcript_6916/g.22431  ORF Transcript_6916/g.22431 Transcript_6916/m.22431 type:complete len:105 (-) Transcript_6916:304-618(-)